jgi:hypothetical protein
MNKTTSKPVEDELDAIRIKLHEETKDMSSADQVAYMRKKAEDGLHRHGYKLVPTGDKGAMRLARM